MGAQVSAVREKITQSPTKSPPLPCLNCKAGQMKFIGSIGQDREKRPLYAHYCTNCGRNDQFTQIYGLDA